MGKNEWRKLCNAFFHNKKVLQFFLFFKAMFLSPRISAANASRHAPRPQVKTRGEWHITWHVACFVLRVVPILWVFKHVSFVRSCRVMSDHFELCDIMWFVSVEFDAFDEFEVKMCQNCRDVFPESHSFDSCFFLRSLRRCERLQDRICSAQSATASEKSCQNEALWKKGSNSGNLHILYRVTRPVKWLKWSQSHNSHFAG